MRPSVLLLALALALAAGGCSSSGSEEPEPALGSGSVTVRVDGGAPAAFDGIAISATAPASGGRPPHWVLAVADGFSVGDMRIVSFSWDGTAPGPGTYPIQEGPGEGTLSGFYSDTREASSALALGQSGTLTVERVTETGVFGRFAFEARDFEAPDRRYAIEGRFSARIGQAPPDF